MIDHGEMMKAQKKRKRKKVMNCFLASPHEKAQIYRQCFTGKSRAVGNKKNPCKCTQCVDYNCAWAIPDRNVATKYISIQNVTRTHTITPCSSALWDLKCSAVVTIDSSSAVANWSMTHTVLAIPSFLWHPSAWYSGNTGCII